MQIFRALHIARVMLRYGLDEVVLSSFERPDLLRRTRFLRWGRKLTAPRGQRLRMALEALGPIFVKFGQVLSTRADLLPPDIAAELALLQDRVPPFDSAIAVATIERSFGKPLADVFLSFDLQPIASASIAQVHFAEIADKTTGAAVPVAVKVLRPGMDKVIGHDIALMRQMATWLQALSEDGKRLKPLAVVDEFDKYLHDELDLMREASNATQLARNMATMREVQLPTIYWDWCRTEVMTMQRMGQDALPISQIDALKAAGVNMPQLARDGVTIFFTQVFKDGFFHADMHPGNLLVSTAPASLGRFILLDFGIVGSLTDYDKRYLAQNFAAFFERNYRRVAELHIESGWVAPGVNVADLEGAIRSVCEPYFDKPLREISLGMVLMRLFQVSRRFQVEIQPQLVLLQKTLLNVEGLARQLDPEMDLWQTAQPFLRSWLNEQMGPKRLLRELKSEAPQWAALLPAMPRLVHDYLAQHSQAGAQKASEAALLALIAEQRETNRQLQRIIYAGVGFVIGALVVLVVLRLRQMGWQI